jgi:CubicO group peptidase (beta-lactamase class C family)
MRRLVAIVLFAAGCSPSATADDAAEEGLDGLWKMNWRRQQWEPRLVDGFFTLRSEGPEPFGRGWVDTLCANRAFFDVTGWSREEGSVGLTFELDCGGKADTYRVDATRLGDELEGSLVWGTEPRMQHDVFEAVPRRVARFDPFHADPRLPVAEDPASAGIDPDLLDALVLLADESRSDALVVVSGGQLVAERYFGRAPTKMSCESITKGVSSLALGFLQEEGKVTDLETPLSRWFPEFADDERKEITLRHLLTHTTGLDRSMSGLNGAGDKVADARKAVIVEPPGTKYAYSNRAMALLSGIVRAETGGSVREYLEPRLFAPLGMSGRYTWRPDEAGNPVTYSGLMVEPIDLAVLGAVLADDGAWDGKAVVPERWVQQMAKPASPAAPEMGLVWRLIRDPKSDEPIGYLHSGTQGQYLLVFPEADLVIVRMVTIKGDGWGDEAEIGFPGLLPIAERMALAKMAASGG